VGLDLALEEVADARRNAVGRVLARQQGDALGIPELKIGLVGRLPATLARAIQRQGEQLWRARLRRTIPSTGGMRVDGPAKPGGGLSTGARCFGMRPTVVTVLHGWPYTGTVDSSGEAKMHPGVETLFRPFPFGEKTLSNRIVMAPMTRSMSSGGVPTAEVAAYYRHRVEGGVGLIVTEGTVVNHPAASGYPAVPRMYGEDALDGWRRVVEEVHGAGGVIVPQLWHVGSVRQRGMEPDPEVPGYGPSAIPHPGVENAEPPVEMSEADIAAVIEAFAQAAANARAIGFDGVEIHGAHGYLIDQFFWERTNRRSDRWGGDPVARSRFALEIVRAVRRTLGPDLPIILRFSQWKSGEYDARLVQSPEELERFLTPFVEAGVDVFHASTRRYWEPEFEGSGLNLAGWTKKLTGKPAITVGSVGLDSDFLGAFAGRSPKATGIDELLRRMEAGEFDLVAVGRALLADPRWPAKVREGRLEEIVPFTPECLGRLT